MKQGTPALGALIIGNEILSGKRADKHFDWLTQTLAERGLRLSWATYLGDDQAALTRILQNSLAEQNIVFSFGGIGVTPDDRTRQAAAAALGVELVLHPEAHRKLIERFGDGLDDNRLQLGVFPTGAAIIPNPFNQIPGFSIRDHHFVPGFPQMAWPMIEWVLDTHYRSCFGAHRTKDRAFLLTGPNAYESALLDLMKAIVDQFPELDLFSLPSIGEDGERRWLELGVEGAPERVDQAMEIIREEIERRGIAWRERDEEQSAR